MGIGIQIKKPDHVNPAPGSNLMRSNSMRSSSESLHWLYYSALILTFPAALVALFFFFQTRSV